MLFKTYSINTSMNTIFYPPFVNDPLHNIKTSVQTSLINNLKTNNILFDSIITLIIITIIGQLINYISSNVTKIPNYTSNIINYFKKLFYNKNTNVYTKKIIISEITEQKELNKLYNAYFWYLTKNINLIKESPLHYSFTNDITLDEKEKLRDSTINQSLHNYTTKEFTYKKYIIKYSFENKIINIYGDKERKRENNIINLETEYKNSDTNDIFIDLSKYIMLEYIKSQTTFIWKQKIFYLKDNEWIDMPSNNLRNINTLILKENQKEKLFDQIKLFFESEKWYCERDIPYQIGYLLYGPPGTGKTSFIKTISNYTKRHIHYLNLSQVSNDTQLVELLKDIKYDTTILVIEDIDCLTDILHDRNITNPTEIINETLATTQAIMDVIKTVTHKDNDKFTIENKLTLSGILNALDGVFNFHGRILILTSNKPEVLDKAFLRPGRVDNIEYFSNCDTYQLISLYKCFYDNINDTIINKIKQIPNDKYSPAHIINIFLKNRLTPEHALECLITN